MLRENGIHSSSKDHSSKKVKGNREENVEQILRKANFFFSQLKLTDALPLYKQALDLQKNNVEALLGKAACLQNLGLIQEALTCLSLVLTLEPSNVRALTHSGLIFKESDRITEAVTAFEKALISDPESTTARSYLATVLTDIGTRLKVLGNIDLALENYLQAIKIDTSYSPAYYNIGVVYSELQRFDEAIKYYLQAIEKNPVYVEAYCNIGVIHKALGRLEEAIEFYEKALLVNSNFIIARNNLAIALTDLGTKYKTEGKVKKSIKCYKKALTYNYQYADAYYNLGVVYGEQRKYDTAIRNYELAIHFNPLCCEAYNNVGVIHKDCDNLEKAIQCYEAALMINPKFHTTLNNIGVIFTVQGKMDEALLSLQSAIAENPAYAEAHNNLGVLYRDEGKIQQAIECYDKCLQLAPHSRNASQNRLLAMNYIEMDIDLVYKNHLTWGEMIQKLLNPSPLDLHLNFIGDFNRVLRIGYISPDFFTHSVSYFIEGPLTYHDPTKVFVTCYSNVVKEDQKTLKLKKLAHSWKDIVSLNAEQTADLVRSDSIDILIELAGHTAGNRLDVMAMKPAPIQITYVGYPNTTGLSTIDYRLTDKIVDPCDSKQAFVEQLVYLPNCFLNYTPSSESGDEVVPLPCLTNEFITFGSFNSLAKITDGVIELWSTIMHSMPDSRLVVKCKPFTSATVRERFLTSFADRGIDSSRLSLLPLIASGKSHLQCYQYMDISLDTFPYAGTTTTCESLWMGVPVVTLRGNTHAHNVGISILSTIGYQSLIAETKEDYIKIAVELASDTSRLTEIRKALRDTMAKSYLCDSVSFTKNLEDVYLELWQKFLKNRAEDALDLCKF